MNHKCFRLLSLAIILLSAQPVAFCQKSQMSAVAAPAQDDPTYRLVWADEFEVDGMPDAKNWVFEQGFVRNKELQYYKSSNAICSDGLLVIEAKREKVINENFSVSSADWRKNRPNAEYTSACLTTRGLHSWKYARIYVHARIDAREGLWPAIWTIGDSGKWPECGEIDIMEYYAGDILANACWSTGIPWKPKWDAVRTPLSSLGDSDWSSHFHTWCLDWNEKWLKIFVDDRLLNTVELDKTIAVKRKPRSPFAQPHHLLLNLAVGGTKGGDPSQTTFPSRFEIDYVRVYQR